jgi:hypothetical protein
VFSRAPRSFRSKNQLRSKNFQPNILSSKSSIAELLQKMVEQAPTPWFSWSSSGGAPPTLSFLELMEITHHCHRYVENDRLEYFLSRSRSHDASPRSQASPSMVVVRPLAAGETASAPAAAAAGGEADSEAVPATVGDEAEPGRAATTTGDPSRRHFSGEAAPARIRRVTP